MESNGKVIAVTGSSGKLAPFVLGALGTAGFRVATDTHVSARFMLDLEIREDASYLVDEWQKRFGRIDGIVALTGAYEQHRGEESREFKRIALANLMPVVNIVAELLPSLRERQGSVIAISAAGHYAPKEAGYRAGKSALDAYLHGLSHDEPLIDVAYIVPDGPIDTDEKRSKLASHIVSLVRREASSA